MFLVDSHCHLDFPQFAGDVPQILARAAEAQVGKMLTIATTLDAAPAARALAETHSAVYFAVGLHPLHVHESPLPSVRALERLAAHPKMVGLGETGFDNHYSRAHSVRQEESLAIHIETAQHTGLPLIIHTREADEAITQALRAGLRKGRFEAVMHCFSSGEVLAEAALSMGFYLSMSGIATFPKSGTLRTIFREAPLERILVETDAPYLAPVPVRGRRNEPAYVAHTAAAGARLRQMSLEDFARATTENFHRLFPKAAEGRTA